ncbi:DUF1254 domain-containing protein [Nocardioides taihuensis]|uniref:DUF1254 domain-containing protein n=1 Tax=Nocardioides taihuensis TaxID=1835606 RepID=A0ABW0BR12_9ACTN
MSTLHSDVRTLSREAYTFLYPLVTMEMTRRRMTNHPRVEGQAYGPANRFHHARTFPPADFRAVVRPNFDTLYSSGWLDLTRGPVVIEVPDSDDRYFMVPMLDMWTDVFASPGKRTTGTGPQRYVVTAPGFEGPLPQDATHVAAPTPYVWVIGRTQTDGPADYEAVGRFQDGWSVTELGEPVGDAVDPGVDTETEPLRLVNGLSAVDYFSLAAQLLRVVPTHHSDHDQLSRMALLGLVPGEDFDASRFEGADLAELEAGAVDARQTLQSSLGAIGRAVNGWVVPADTMGVYGNYYLKRALVTLVGLGANPAEDAVYPVLLADADGQPVTGDAAYVIHFEADQLPPVAAFWSITMYDAEGFQAANELDRFAIGDRDALTFNADGSLDIYVQHAHPGPDRAANWLPAPTGPLGITMRLYAPAAEVLTGAWNPPPARRIGLGDTP